MDAPIVAKPLPFLVALSAPVPVDDAMLFSELFSATALETVFKEEFANTSGKGVDRLNGFQFAANSKTLLTTASVKCMIGTYRFSPFLEVLRTKGRNMHPARCWTTIWPAYRSRLVCSF